MLKSTYKFAVADMIYNARKSNGLAQEQLSDLTGIAQNKISAYETGRICPKLETIVKITQSLNKTLLIDIN